MAKNYNPFKMLGSYLGGAIYLMPLILGMTCKAGWGCLIYFVPYLPIFPILNLTGDLIVGGIIIFVIGFLIGWGIHSLIRWLRE